MGIQVIVQEDIPPRVKEIDLVTTDRENHETVSKNKPSE